MLMRTSSFKTGGYSGPKFFEFIPEDTKVVLLKGGGPIKQVKFENGQPTDTVDNVKIEVYFEGFGADKIKLPADFKLDPSIKDMQEITLVNPEACEVQRNIYFKADSIKPVK